MKTMSPLLFVSMLLQIYINSCFVSGHSPCAASEKRRKCSSSNRCIYQPEFSMNVTSPDWGMSRSTLNGCDEETATAPMCCQSATCTTPEGTRGRCIGLSSCPYLLKLLQGSRSKPNLKYFQESRCEGPAEYSVCCDPEQSSRGSYCRPTAHPPDASTGCCGLNVKRRIKRLVGGDVMVDAYEHPWLVTIMYSKEDELVALCGGALISGQYVVTAGHCVTGPMLNRGTPVNVLFSQPDCDGAENCNDWYSEVVPIEKTTPHPDYNPYTSTRKYDIALVRLVLLVEFTDFIRPICLASFDIGVVMQEGGSGIQGSKNSRPMITMPNFPKKDFESSNYTEDPAGPLITENGKLYQLNGMVTLRTSSCGEQKIDGSYTNVYLYLEWIRSQIVADEANLEDEQTHTEKF